jgi:hypothetical protein
MPAADLMQHVFLGHFAILEEDRRRRAAVNAHFVLFVAWLESRKGSLHDEGGELFSVNLREDDVNIRESAVGDPHLLAIQNVVCAFRIQFRASQRIL